MTNILVDSVKPAVDEVVGSMAGIETQRGEQVNCFPEGSNTISVSVIIGLSDNNVKGIIMVHFEKSILLAIAKNAFMIEESELTPEVMDVAGEITNMICGNIKKNAVAKGFSEYSITVPTIVSGQNFHASAQLKSEPVIMPFVSDGGKIFVELRVDC